MKNERILISRARHNIRERSAIVKELKAQAARAIQANASLSLLSYRESANLAEAGLDASNVAQSYDSLLAGTNLRPKLFPLSSAGDTSTFFREPVKRAKRAQRASIA